MANYKPYKDIKIDRRYKPAARKAIAEDIIDHIIKRSLNGKDINNKAFPKYSKGYTKSLDFKNAGKSKSKVNLRLSFEMLNSLDLKKSNAGKLRIGVDKANAKKSEGNETGSYGDKTGHPSKARKFIGISAKDLKTITAKYPLEKKTTLADAIAAAQAIREAAEKEAEKLAVNPNG